MPAAPHSNGSTLARHLDGLMEVIAGNHRIVLAVSGGADSMALLTLTAERLPPEARAQVLVVTVDHGWRAQSRSHAERVGQRAQALGLRHVIVTITDTRPTETAARAARYDALIQAARADAASWIVTAHTADDQAETLLMRLARGSGVDGLAAMPRLQPLRGLTLYRPLLDVPHTALTGYLMARGLSWLDDPANQDPAHERVRLRLAAATLEALGLSTEALCRTAQRLGRAKAALEAETGRQAALTGRLETSGAVVFDRPAWQALPSEIRIRLLQKALQTASGNSDPAPLAALEEAEAALVEGATGRTLHGALIHGTRTALTVLREQSRIAVPQQALAPGAVTVWDNRFLIALADVATAAVTVRLPTEAELDALSIKSAAARRLAAVTPFIVSGTELRAAPCLNRHDPTITCRLLADWPLPSDPKSDL